MKAKYIGPGSYLANLGQEERIRIASMGGKAVVREYGRDFMSSIGKKGGRVVSQNKEHMATIGRKGGLACRRSGA